MSSFSQTYMLLRNEGHLLQGCLKSALSNLLASSSVERGALYAALFTYSIGLERLLKISLILDHCVTHKGAFPSQKMIREFGHDVATLYKAAKAIADRYQVEIPGTLKTDDLDEKLIQLVAGFANSGGRYFNLDSLTGTPKSSDPLPEWGKLLVEIYNRDVSVLKRASHEEQVEALAESMKEWTVYLPATALTGAVLSYEDFCMDHGKIILVMPEVVWRFARLLYPFQMLVFEMNAPLRSGLSGRPVDFPHMWEFCAFCSSDKEDTLAEIRAYNIK